MNGSNDYNQWLEQYHNSYIPAFRELQAAFQSEVESVCDLYGLNFEVDESSWYFSIPQLDRLEGLQLEANKFVTVACRDLVVFLCKPVSGKPLGCYLKSYSVDPGKYLWGLALTERGYAIGIPLGKVIIKPAVLKALDDMGVRGKSTLLY